MTSMTTVPVGVHRALKAEEVLALIRADKHDYTTGELRPRHLSEAVTPASLNEQDLKDFGYLEHPVPPGGNLPKVGWLKITPAGREAIRAYGRLAFRDLEQRKEVAKEAFERAQTGTTRPTRNDQLDVLHVLEEALILELKDYGVEKPAEGEVLEDDQKTKPPQNYAALMRREYKELQAMAKPIAHSLKVKLNANKSDLAAALAAHLRGETAHDDNDGDVVEDEDGNLVMKTQRPPDNGMTVEERRAQRRAKHDQSRAPRRRDM